MPGVPTGRGCDACRQQKKKCDLSIYPCPRCRRLKISCIGLGQRRFKFVHDDRGSTPGSTPSPAGRELDVHFTTALRLSRNPSNETTRLADAFADKINPARGIKYNLAWTYGDYLNHVPSRLGKNEALDSATESFLSAVQSFASPVKESSPVVLEKYGQALASLRKCLDDPAKARAPETLCAILFLWNTQQFIYTSAAQVATHGQGVAQLIRIRGCAEKSSDFFESNLLLSLRAVVLFDSLFNGQVEFTDQEWIDMFNTHKRGDLTPEGRVVQCITRLPNLMRRSKAVLLGDPRPGDSLKFLRTCLLDLREEVDPSLFQLRQRWEDNSNLTEGMHPKFPLPADMIHCHFMRSYALALSCVIFINETRLALQPDHFDIAQESHDFALEIYELARIASRYRPFGAFAMGVCLIAASLGVEDDEKAARAVLELRCDYATDFRGVEQTSEKEHSRLICGREWSRLLPGIVYLGDV